MICGMIEPAAHLLTKNQESLEDGKCAVIALIIS